jgi:hypothetical protein
VFVALRSVAPGDEITYDYGREYFDFFFKKGGCRCTACRTKAAAVSPEKENDVQLHRRRVGGDEPVREGVSRSGPRNAGVISASW